MTETHSQDPPQHSTSHATGTSAKPKEAEKPKDGEDYQDDDQVAVVGPGATVGNPNAALPKDPSGVPMSPNTVLNMNIKRS